MIRTGNAVSKEIIRNWIGECFVDLTAEADGWSPKGFDADREQYEQLCFSQEAVAMWQHQRSTQTYGPPVIALARSIATGHGIELEGLPESPRADLLDGAARALIECEKLFQLRLHDKLIPFVPADPLFALASTTTLTPHPATPTNAVVGPTLDQAVTAYLAHKKSQWRPKTYASRLVRLGHLLEHLGANTALAAITPHDVRGFRDAVLRLRKKRRVGLTFAQKQTDNVAARITSKTAELTMEPAKAFFRWAVCEEGYIETDPSQNVKIVALKQKLKTKKRRPFDEDELRKLFGSTVFVGCAGLHRRFAPGPHIIQDARYWIPILGFYMGARLGEIVQLHLTDIHLDGPIAFIDIAEDMTKEAGEDFKQIKSSAGIRQVPLHPDLLALGFADFVKKRRKQKRASKRLFFEVRYGADQQASTTFSKWFGRFMDQIGLNDPALVFHSFRHAAEDAFRNAGHQQYAIDRIIGHADGATSAGYGNGIDIETAYQAVRSMKLKIRLPEIWTVEENHL